MTPSGTEQFIQALQVAFEKGSLHKCTLSKPVKHAGSDLKNVYLRPVQLKKGLHLAFNFRYKTRDEVKNYLLEPALEELRNLLTNNFQNADLLTTERDFSLKISGNGKELFSQQKASQKDVPVMSHNREKQRLIDASSPWLYHLGITNSKGEVLAKSQDKWRQINKYLEIIQNLNAQTPLPKEPIIADMGSGKGYLTFALYDYLFNQLELKPQITGIELRKELVKTCNKAAENSGFDGLHFEALNISDYHPPRLDMLIALHACDVATDMALAGGIHANANMIIAAPCCHKQIRKEMSTQNELAPLLRHGILEERQAELITDGIRALLLESEGYQTKVFEFVSTEHTAKNVMITAVKSGKAVDKRREKSLDQIESIKSGFGIKKHYLETLLSKKK
ncbi:MAG: SAM-dependent methyltransferase [Lewinellaceae bacterium]|nr:SAM-dependent methyltransferase [Lewinellaceae bacterium]